jgi:hypothetical protein
VGDDLECEVGACRIAYDLDVLRLDTGGYEVFDRDYSLFKLSWECGAWDEGFNRQELIIRDLLIKMEDNYCNLGLRRLHRCLSFEVQFEYISKKMLRNLALAAEMRRLE